MKRLPIKLRRRLFLLISQTLLLIPPGFLLVNGLFELSALVFVITRIAYVLTISWWPRQKFEPYQPPGYFKSRFEEMFWPPLETIAFYASIGQFWVYWKLNLEMVYWVMAIPVVVFAVCFFVRMHMQDVRAVAMVRTEFPVSEIRNRSVKLYFEDPISYRTWQTVMTLSFVGWGIGLAYDGRPWASGLMSLCFLVGVAGMVVLSVLHFRFVSETDRRLKETYGAGEGE